MPKCDTKQIEQELAQLEGKGFHCAVRYLKAELARRKGSTANKGRPTKADTEKRRKWREASARWREKQAENDERVIVPIDDV